MEVCLKGILTVLHWEGSFANSSVTVADGATARAQKCLFPTSLMDVMQQCPCLLANSPFVVNKTALSLALFDAVWRCDPVLRLQRCWFLGDTSQHRFIIIISFQKLSVGS